MLYTQPLKMELIQGSETSANYNLTPGKYPKENIQCKWCSVLNFWIRVDKRLSGFTLEFIECYMMLKYIREKMDAPDTILRAIT